MRRYDLLEEYAILIAPHFGPQARARPRPTGRSKHPMPKARMPNLWPAPATLLVIGIVLLAAL